MVTPIKHDVFRFVALRPPTPVDGEDPATGPIQDPRPLEETLVGKLIAGLGEGRSHRGLLRLVQAEIERSGMEPTIPTDGPAKSMRDVVAVIRRHRVTLDATRLPDDLKTALERKIADFVKSDEAAQIRGQLWDRLEMHYLLNRVKPSNVEELVEGLRALNLLDAMAAGRAIDSAADLEAAMAATLVLPDTAMTTEPETPEPRPRDEEREERDKRKREEYRRLWEEFVELHRSMETVRHAPMEAVITRVRTPPTEAERRELATSTREVDTLRSRAIGDLVTEESSRLTLNRAVLERLPERARRIVEHVQPGDELSDKPAVLTALQGRLTQVADRVFSTTDPLLFEVMPAEAIEIPGVEALSKSYAVEASFTPTRALKPVAFPWVARPVIRPLGIGDLKVVKETLLRYMTGEVAHIENVLKGEDKERRHRRLERTEETFTVEIETIEETERDNQTTDRFELKKETEKTIQTDLSVDAGITVSASYGPVELGAYANFAYSQSSTETTRNSMNFVRDVIDRSVTKIQKRAREERITRTLKEIEEINVHGLTNVGAADHITGIYRWVDKEYEAQIYNYGKRMMFEFMVPEPAAYYYYSQENDPANAINIKKPQDLGFLRHTDINEWNFGSYIRAYNIQGIAPPPPPVKVITFALDQSGMTDDQSISKSTRELVVPEGYVARSWGYVWRGWVGSDSYLRLLVGLRASDGSSLTLNGEDSVVPIGMVGHDLRAFSATIEVFCDRTQRAYEAWQIATFEKIVAAYETAMAMYEDKLKAAEVSRGVIIEGRNPALNRIIVNNELKKLCLSLFTGQDYSTFDAVSGTPPVMDLNEAVEEGEFIQFFEQAFEWEQMTYLFYPYFWSRPTTWNRRINFNDVDPRFNQFLQAGSARVVVPVHPAYNEAILHYVETGAIWNGGDPPHIDDPMFLSIVEELKAATDDLAGATPEGDPWTVTVPTTLIYLQPDSNLPDFTA